MLPESATVNKNRKPIAVMSAVWKSAVGEARTQPNLAESLKALDSRDKEGRARIRMIWKVCKK